jgi:ADP-heptose:LPS heptosyltransferase
VPDADTRLDPVRRVCVFARSWHQGLGDLVPVNLFLQVLRQAYPRAEITHVVGEEAAARQAEFFARHSCADRIVRCPNYWDHELAHWEEFFAGVRSAAYDCCILDPLSQPLVAKQMAGCGASVRIGFASGAADEQYLTSAIPVRPAHGCPDLLDFVQALAGAVGVAAPAPEAAVPWFPFVAQPVPVLPPPVVAVHPGGARYWNRRWPLARFGELGRRLAAGKGEGEGGASLVLLGPAEEAGDLAELAALVGGQAGAVVEVCAGESLDTVASWLAAADVLVGNDSALAHVAAALGTPAVVLYGPSGDEFMWERLYPRHRAIHGHATCEPMRDEPPAGGRVPCAHSCAYEYVCAAGPYPRCLTGIDAAEVHAVVREVLSHRAERSAGARR